MKQISVYDFYILGKALEPLFQMKSDTLTNEAGFDAIAAYRQLKNVVQEDSVFLPGTRKAANSLMELLVKGFYEGIKDGFPLFYEGGSDDKVGWKAEEIVQAVTAFDTVFDHDVPRMAVFSAQKKGIYGIDDLIDHGDQHFPGEMSKMLPKQARLDLIASGRSLAFNLATASAFHMWRALEVVFGAYHVSITGKTFEEAKTTRNWGEYIRALRAAGADQKITGNLDYIRAEYRNPVVHPNVNVKPDEAFGLFGIGISAITQIMQAIESQPYAAKALS
jgi:hypothetical protein